MALVEEVRPRMAVSRPLYDPGSARHPGHRRHAPSPAASRGSPTQRPVAGEDTPIRLGSRVRHPKFGEGVVLRYEGNGANQQMQLNFAQTGQKWLMYAYAKLETM